MEEALLSMVWKELYYILKQSIILLFYILIGDGGPRYCRFFRIRNCWNGTDTVAVDRLDFTGVSIEDQCK